MFGDEVFNDPKTPMHDSNFLKCACCGKYKVDTNEEFYISFTKAKKKYWLCEKCNKAKQAFVRSSSDLVLIIASGRVESEDYAVYSRESVCK